MGAKSEAIAKKFEGKAKEALAALKKLSDEDWKKITQGEKWSVAATAHHMAGSFDAVAGIAKALVSGNFRSDFTRAALDGMNAAHAKEHASCSKAETVALFEKGWAGAAAFVRGLSDEQLAKTGTVFADLPPLSVEQLIHGGLIDHLEEHLGSIRKTVGG